jgi:hypothetical protein
MKATTMLPVAALALGLLLCPPRAEADYPKTAPVRPVQMTDLAGLTEAGLDIQYTTWTEPLPGNEEADVTAVTVEPSIDVTLAPHWQVFGRLPLAHDDIEIKPVDDSDCCGWALGNLTVGGRYLYSERHPSGLLSVIGGEMSLSLATASDSGDAGIAANDAAFARRSHDPGRYLPNTWTPRFTFHGQLFGDRFMAQLEGGLHFFLYDSDVPDDDLDLGLRLAVAGGFRITPELALIAELNSLFFFYMDDGVDDDRFSSVDFGVRYGGEQILLGLRAYVPIDDVSTDLDMLGFGADVGLRW